MHALEIQHQHHHVGLMDPYRLPGPRPGLFQRAIAAAAAGVVLVSLFFLGIIAWIVIAGVVLVGSISLLIWGWRQRRALRRFRDAYADQLRQQENKSRGEAASVIDGEYTVVSKQHRRD